MLVDRPPDRQSFHGLQSLYRLSINKATVGMVLLPLDDFSRSSRHFGEQLSIRKLSVNRGWGMLQHMQSTVFLGNPVVGKIQS